MCVKYMSFEIYKNRVPKVAHLSKQTQKTWILCKIMRRVNNEMVWLIRLRDKREEKNTQETVKEANLLHRVEKRCQIVGFPDRKEKKESITLSFQDEFPQTNGSFDSILAQSFLRYLSKYSGRAECLRRRAYFYYQLQQLSSLLLRMILISRKQIRGRQKE